MEVEVDVEAEEVAEVEGRELKFTTYYYSVQGVNHFVGREDLTIQSRDAMDTRAAQCLICIYLLTLFSCSILGCAIVHFNLYIRAYSFSRKCIGSWS